LHDSVAFTVSGIVACAEPLVSITVKITLKGDPVAVVVMPEITPVAAATENPEGRPVADQERAPLPPLAARVAV
jgi:hypothetical protein